MEITNMSLFEKVFFFGVGGLIGGVSFGVVHDAGYPLLAWSIFAYIMLACARMTETHATKGE